MLSFYDALAYSLQKKSLLGAFCAAMVMLIFLILVICSMQNHFALCTLFKGWLQAPSGSATAISALGQIAYVLNNPLFWGWLFRKTLIACFLFFFLGISYFAFELVVAKKALFNQPKHFTAQFFFITLTKIMLLLSPLLGGLYIFFDKMLKSGFSFVASTVVGLSPTYRFPFSGVEFALFSTAAAFYFIYVFLRLVERFSFLSLLNPVPFFKHLTTVFELIFKIILDNAVLIIGLVGWGLLYWQADSLYVCFFVCISYLLWTAICSSARWIFMMPLFVIGLGIAFFAWTLGMPFFNNYLLYFLVVGILYFCFFFLWFAFWSVLAYLFASAAYVLRFNKSPAKDIKESNPEKLRRIDTLYNEYLTEHKNNTQDNFFHHL